MQGQNILIYLEDAYPQKVRSGPVDDSLWDCDPVGNLKPIFLCDAKPLTLGPGVGLDPQSHTFASPNAKNSNMLVHSGVT